MRKLLAVALIVGLVTIGCKKSEAPSGVRPTGTPTFTNTTPEGTPTKAPPKPPVEPPPPAAELTADKDAVTVEQGGKAEVKLTLKNNTKALEVKAEGAPEGLTVTGKFDTGKDSATVEIKAAADAKEGDSNVTLSAGGASKKIKVTVKKKA